MTKIEKTEFAIFIGTSSFMLMDLEDLKRIFGKVCKNIVKKTLRIVKHKISTTNTWCDKVLN